MMPPYRTTYDLSQQCASEAMHILHACGYGTILMRVCFLMNTIGQNRSAFDLNACNTVITRIHSVAFDQPVVFSVQSSPEAAIAPFGASHLLVRAIVINQRVTEWAGVNRFDHGKINIVRSHSLDFDDAAIERHH